MCQTKGEHDRSLSIHLSLPFSPSTPLPTPLSAVILSVPSLLLPLSASGQSLANSDKRMPPVMEKEQRSWLSGGGGGVAGCQGWKGIVKAVAIYCCFLGLLPTSPVSSVSDFL